MANVALPITAVLGAGIVLIAWRVIRQKSTDDTDASAEQTDAPAEQQETGSVADTPSDDPYAAAAASIRETAKWLIASFGAIGAALVVGLQLSDLGSVDRGTYWFAVLAITVGLAGVGFAVSGVSGLLLPRNWTLDELAHETKDKGPRQILDRHLDLISPFESVDDMARMVEDDQKALKDAFRGYMAKPPTVSIKAYNAAVDRADLTGGMVTDAIKWARYGGLMADYRRAMQRRVIPGVVIAVAGLLAFVVISQPPTSPSSDANLSGSHLANSVLDGARLPGVNLKETDLTGASLVDVDLTGADLTQADLTGADLTSANLRDATMTTAKLTGVVWSRTTCPDGVVSDDVGSTCVAHLTVSGAGSSAAP